MNPSTSKEEIIEIARSLFRDSPEKILENTISMSATFEPQSLADIGKDVTDIWVVVFEVDLPIEINFIVVYVHDKTHETTIMSTM